MGGAPATSDADDGRPLLHLAVGATGLFVVVQLAALVHPDGPVLATAVIVSLVLFLVGCLSFVWGFLAGVGRSRDEAVTLGALLLAQGAGTQPRRILFGTLTVQVVVSLVAAGLRPFTPVAFGILTPMLGVGLLATWGGRFGVFEDLALAPQTGAASFADTAHVADAAAPAPSAKRPVREPAPQQDIDDFDRLWRGRRRRGRGAPE